MNPNRTAVDVADAMSGFRFVVSRCMASADELVDAVRRSPSLEDRLRPVIAQAYAIADVARDAERDLAAIHAEVRDP